MSTSRAPVVRAGAVAAVGFLLLDAILLALAAAWTEQPLLFAWAALLALGAVGVYLLWRRYLTQLSELDTQRRAMRHEIEDLRTAFRNDAPQR